MIDCRFSEVDKGSKQMYNETTDCELWIFEAILECRYSLRVKQINELKTLLTWISDKATNNPVHGDDLQTIHLPTC